MNRLKIRRQILRNYARAIVELEERGVSEKELIYKKILERASKVGFEIYKREQELKREYYQCSICRRYLDKKEDNVVKYKELIEELQLVLRPSSVCSVCTKEEVAEYEDV